ncbi:LEA type 2 family protein [Chitinolyticbacter meiyuanensis]|uniref:LEA type 2 family protein n=1 Tax=Chitinolyticbacter meiyuanensis TaxID=682798 RepID=UPI0011E5BEB9|nr:LEA type 2 family protein [Chitinolyticbacter meiyuanensis]
MRRLIIIACALLLAACAGVPSHFEKPRVSLAGIALKEAGILEQRFTLTLRVENPNDVAIPIKGLDTTLEINGQPLASGVAASAVTLPALGEARVAIDVTSNIATLLRQLRRAAESGAPRYKLAGKLFVPMRPDGLPFSVEGEVPAIDGLFDPKPNTQQF